MYQERTPRQPDENGDHWTPVEIASLLEGIDVRWCVVGGWALDLADVRPERPHGDLEIAIPQFELDRLRAWLPAYEFFVMGRNGYWPADAAGGAYFDNPQTFIRDPRTGAWKADVIRSQYDGDTWVCQMERSVRRPYSEAVGVTDAGIPYLQPELVLLYKGLTRRARDDDDFDTCCAALGRERRTWLAAALSRHAGADHPWLAKLDD